MSIAQLVTPEIRTVVAPNVDTTYTVGQLDLSDGPLVIDVPDTRGRYYVIQLLDAYSNTFAYAGRRTTGTRPGAFAIVPPGFSGSLPDGVRRIRSPTRSIWLLGRTLVRDQADLAAVTALMWPYTLTPPARWSAGERQGSLVLPAFPPRQTGDRAPVRARLTTAWARPCRRIRRHPATAARCAPSPLPASGPPDTLDSGRGRRLPALAAAPRTGERPLERAVERVNAYSRKAQ